MTKYSAHLVLKITLDVIAHYSSTSLPPDLQDILCECLEQVIDLATSLWRRKHPKD